MRLLLDTHMALWWWADGPRLPRRLRDAIAEPGNEIFFSAASAWEIATKERLGKLDDMRGISAALQSLLLADRFKSLPVTLEHGQRAGAYAMSHGDPFDRMLAAQSEMEDIPLATLDKALAAFPGPRWRR